jgi:hypothetical protein
MKNIIFLSTQLFFIFSCVSHQKKSKFILVKMNKYGKHIKKVNDIVYQDTVTKLYYYNSIGTNESQTIIRLEALKLEDDSPFTKLDELTFKSYGTFWLDKNYIYDLKEQSDGKIVSISKIKSYSKYCFFENSKYSIINDTLFYNGSRCLIDVNFCNCNDSIIKQKINLNEFEVVKTSKNFSEGIEDYAYYKANLYRNGFKEDTNKNYAVTNILQLVKDRQFCKRINVPYK